MFLRRRIPIKSLVENPIGVVVSIWLKQWKEKKVSDYIINPIKKVQDLLAGWHLELLGGHQLKKNTIYLFFTLNHEIYVW